MTAPRPHFSSRFGVIMTFMGVAVGLEGMVMGFVEQMTNDNAAMRDAFGRTIRSSHKANKVPAGTLGKLMLHTKEWGIIPVGCGKMDHAERKYVWDHQDEYMDKVSTFNYQKEGMKDKPRFPRHKGWRKD